MRKRMMFTAGAAVSVVFATSIPSSVIAAGIPEEVVVVGSSTSIERVKLGSSVTVLDRATITHLGVEYAADIFRHVPGLAVSRSGGQGGLTQIRMRGAEGNHVLVLIDGVEVAAAGRGEFDFASLLASDIEKIEVLRGPQSGLYGSNATAGVISITTKGASRKGEFHLSAEGGSDATRQLAVSMAGGNNRVSGRLNVTHRESKFDLSTDDSEMGGEDDKDTLLAISASGTWTINDVIAFDAHGRFSENSTDIDGYDFNGGDLQGLPYDDDSTADNTDVSLGVNANIRLVDGKSLTKFSVTSSHNDSESYSDEYDQDSGSVSSRIGYAAQTTWVYDDTAIADNQTTVFIQREEETFRNTEPSTTDQEPEQERNLTGVGIEHRLGLWNRMYLSGIVRRDHNDAFEDVTTYNARVAVLIPRTGTRLHSSYGVGVTNPSFYEQFGFNPGTFMGNEDLKPEKSTGWDVGIEQAWLDDSLIVDLTYFRSTLEDEISSRYDFVEMISTSVNEEEESDREGAELSLRYVSDWGGSLNGAYTYTHSTEDGEREVRRPLHTASLNGVYQFYHERATIAVNYVYNGEMLDNDFRNGFVAEKTELPSYRVINLLGSLQANDHLQLFARVDNLLDDEYEEVIGYQTPGIGYYAGFRLTLD